jgi:protein-L-isoaspartate(D-aspartate) O-methyltransferase
MKESVPRKLDNFRASLRGSGEMISERLRMVEEQLVERGIRDPRVLEAMRQVPRHLFVPGNNRGLAYMDGPLPLGFGQTISQPYIVALMTEALGLGGKEKVLEIGTGSGFQAAILSRLARQIYTIERIEELANRARKTLVAIGISNVTVVHGDGTWGLPEQAPFDAIIVTAGALEVPKPLIDQLAEGGRLVAPIGETYDQNLLRIIKIGGRLCKKDLGPCIFVPLIGGPEYNDMSFRKGDADDATY